MSVITIHLVAPFYIPGPKRMRLEFVDFDTGETVILVGELHCEEMEVREHEAFGGYMVRRSQLPDRDYVLRYDGHYEVCVENVKSAESAADPKPRRVLDLQNINA